MTRKELIEMKRAGMIEYAAKEFGLGFPKFCNADVMLEEILAQHVARDAKVAAKEAKKPGRPKGS
jgi:hypothetical protein